MRGTLSTRRVPLARCLLNFDESSSYAAMPNFANDNDSLYRGRELEAVGKKCSVSVDSVGSSNLEKFFFVHAEFLGFSSIPSLLSVPVKIPSSTRDAPVTQVPDLVASRLEDSARGYYVVVIVVGDATSVVSVTTPPREKTTAPHPSTGRATLRAIGERPGPLRAT
ncbi:hypothetical protein V1477_007552 [Vespula maculifrons]|uniref:Uncharacterized protein n=1 Tax=Vespula maculifrons TaxID=7453 RepID=A0ABD2CIV1_VESMC